MDTITNAVKAPVEMVVEPVKGAVEMVATPAKGAMDILMENKVPVAVVLAICALLYYNKEQTVKVAGTVITAAKANGQNTLGGAFILVLLYFAWKSMEKPE